MMMIPTTKQQQQMNQPLLFGMEHDFFHNSLKGPYQSCRSVTTSQKVLTKKRQLRPFCVFSLPSPLRFQKRQ